MCVCERERERERSTTGQKEPHQIESNGTESSWKQQTRTRERLIVVVVNDGCRHCCLIGTVCHARPHERECGTDGQMDHDERLSATTTGRFLTTSGVKAVSLAASTVLASCGIKCGCVRCFGPSCFASSAAILKISNRRLSLFCGAVRCGAVG